MYHLAIEKGKKLSSKIAAPTARASFLLSIPFCVVMTNALLALFALGVTARGDDHVETVSVRWHAPFFSRTTVSEELLG